MKDRSLKLDKFFKIINPKYVYLKITPHKSIRNYNSSNIAKAIALSWKGINKVFKIEQKKVFVEFNFKVSYIIDIQDGNANFYFVVPEVFKGTILEKLKEIWGKATVEEVEGIEDIVGTKYQLVYKNLDSLSLSVDKKSNEPLNSILNVMDIMKDKDRITIMYNFKPTTQFGWSDRWEKDISLFRNKKPIEKNKASFSYILKSTLTFIIDITEVVLNCINDFFGGSKTKTEINLMDYIAVSLDRKDISLETKKKKDSIVTDVEIVVASKSEDKTREYNNINAVCNSYRVLDADNELIHKELKNDIKIEQYSWGADSNRMSVDECHNLIQLPGRELLIDMGINFINVNEVKIPQELQEGIKRLGTSTNKGIHTETFLDNDYHFGNLPLVAIGSQGGGKSTYFGNYAKDCSDNNEGLVVIDFIKNCELSDTIKKYVPKEKLVEINLANEEDIQGLGYNEIIIDDTMSDFKKLALANLQAQQIMSFIDSVSVGDPLSGRMRRFLSAAANVVFVQGYNSIRNVVECLEDYKLRDKYINSLGTLKDNLIDEIRTLEELDEWSKPTKDNPSEKIGTRESKIEHILDRIGLLREDFKLKYMYNKPLKDNINLVDCMEKGKVVLIKMKEGDFPSKMVKNVLVTYWISKVWLASQLRGMVQEKPLRCNILIDEVFQAPTSLKTLQYILPQCRKFGCKFVFSTQYANQLDSIFSSLEASGSSFMLLKGSLESDFKHFENKIVDFEYQDLRDMEQFSSLNLIFHRGGYSSFITKLPKPL